MSEDGKGHIPPWMEKIADQGGWKEAEEAMKIISKIKPKVWKAMSGVLEGIKDIASGGVVETIGTFSDDLVETISLQLGDAFAPIKNEVNELLSTVLEPIMPAITTVLNEVQDKLVVGMGAIEALLTGNWDDWFLEQQLKFQAGMDGWSEDLKAFHLEVQKFMYNMKKRWDEFLLNPFETLADASLSPGAGLGIDIGMDIGNAIIAAWTGFWQETGWF